MKTVFMLGLIVGLLAGCIKPAGIIGNIPQVDNDFATVFIARKAGNMQCGRWDGEKYIGGFLIRINDTDFIRLGCGMKTEFKIPVGKTTKISSVSSTISDHYYLEPEKGEKIYFGMDCNFGACWFAPMSRIEWQQISLTCKEVLVIKQ